jgi:hypothetical protein
MNDYQKWSEDMPTSWSAWEHDCKKFARGTDVWLECKCGWVRPLTVAEKRGDWHSIRDGHTGQESLSA